MQLSVSPSLISVKSQLYRAQKRFTDDMLDSSLTLSLSRNDPLGSVGVSASAGGEKTHTSFIGKYRELQKSYIPTLRKVTI